MLLKWCLTIIQCWRQNGLMGFLDFQLLAASIFIIKLAWHLYTCIIQGNWKYNIFSSYSPATMTILWRVVSVIILMWTTCGKFCVDYPNVVQKSSVGFSRVVILAWIVQMWYSKSSIGCPCIVSFMLCNATQALLWKFWFPRKILRGTMRGHAYKCEVINERYCIWSIINN